MEEGNYMDRNTHRDDWGISWPARTYDCNFCNREFKSAQALGGHMNVHRRDRARLRSLSSLPSLVSECPKPNPTNDSSIPTLLVSPPPNFSDEVLNYAQPSPIYSTCLSLSSPPSPPGSTSEDKIFHHFPLLSSQSEEIMVSNNTRSGFDVGEIMKGNAEEEENITLELGLGLLKQPEEKLDLELRLGYF